MVKIAASILNANHEKLGEEILEVTYGGADIIHLDIMDGKFVDNKTDSESWINVAKDYSMLPVDVHLMVENPLKQIEKYKRADRIIFHIETVTDKEAKNIISMLHELNIKIGISVKPATSIEEVEPYINDIDMVLVMTVEPGYGGQKLIPETIQKVKALREKYPMLDIEVDGGINQETASEVTKAGANILVVGTAIFSYEDRETAIKKLKC